MEGHSNESEREKEEADSDKGNSKEKPYKSHEYVYEEYGEDVFYVKTFFTPFLQAFPW